MIRKGFSAYFTAGSLLSYIIPLRKGAAEPQTCVTEHLGQLHLIERSANLFPAWLRDVGIGNDRNLPAPDPAAAADHQRRPNLSTAAARYLDRLGANVEDLFHHVLATLHDPAYREANAGALQMEWPRIPLPGWPEGDADGAATALARSAARGRELARLLDPDTPVPGVTQGMLRPQIAAIAVPATLDGRNMAGDDFALTAGWGHFGQGGAVMPGQGRVVERAYAPDERAVLDDASTILGKTTFDIYLNRRTWWRNVPAAVWRYKPGWLPGPQEVGFLPGVRHPRPPAQAGGGPTLHRHRPADRGDTDDRVVPFPAERYVPAESIHRRSGAWRGKLAAACQDGRRCRREATGEEYAACEAAYDRAVEAISDAGRRSRDASPASMVPDAGRWNAPVHDQRVNRGSTQADIGGSASIRGKSTWC